MMGMMLAKSMGMMLAKSSLLRADMPIKSMHFNTMSSKSSGANF